MIALRLISAACFALFSYWSFLILGCNESLPPLNTGVRIRAELLDSAFQQQDTGSPMPGVHVSGVFISLAPNVLHNGDEHFLDGQTNAQGIDDFPLAITGAYWSFSSNFSNSPVPACGTGSDPNVYIAYPVAEELFSCFPSPVVP